MGNHVDKPQHQDEEDVSSSTFACEICIEPVCSSKRFTNTNKQKCSHHSFCMECVGKHIQAKLEEYNLAEIKCPGLECGEVLDPLTCCPILPENVFVKWCDVLCESRLLEYQSAYCPFRDCSSLILNECGEKVKKTMCPNCKKWLCFECSLPWHEGYGCEEETGVARCENDVLLAQLMKAKKWGRCPNCKHGVELRSGCSSVRCRCGTTFCYDCGRRRCICKRSDCLYMPLVCCAVYILCIGLVFLLSLSLG